MQRMRTLVTAAAAATGRGVADRDSQRVAYQARSRWAHGHRRLPAPRRHLRGEPQLRQPLRHMGLGRRPAGRRAVVRRPGAHHPGRAERRRLRLPAAERRQPGFADPAAHDLSSTRARRGGEPLHQRPVHHRQLHRADRQDLPGAWRVRRERGAQGQLAQPGGCTRDLVHRFYQEQYQLNGGLQNRYVTGSDAVGLAMGHYDTKSLPIYRYLHGQQRAELRDRRPLLPGRVRRIVPQPPVPGRRRGRRSTPRPAPAARTPVCTRSSTPTGSRTRPIRCTTRPTASKDGQLTQACGLDANPNVACGDYAVNTIQPSNAPFGAGAQIAADRRHRSIRTSATELSAKGVSWNWYSGGWNDAVAGHPGPLFQYHHQPFNYFADYAPGQPGRAHLQDETEFIGRGQGGHAARGQLRQAVRRARTSTRATPARPTAATTWSTCSRRC